MNLNAPARSDKRIYNTSPNTSIIPESPPENCRLSLQLDLLTSEGKRSRGSGRIFTLHPYRSQGGKGFHLSCALTGQPFAGVWTDGEVAKIEKRITYAPVSVPEFMAIASAEIFGGGAE